jgi:dTDP-4-dehydrorhamnose 3,5-epimerase
MIFQKTPLPGAYLIDLEKRADHRGFFARAWCTKEFEDQGLSTKLVQVNVSWNKKVGTLRGMHYQTPPNAEVKIVRCTRGAIWDVSIDLRPESPTYLNHFSALLTADNHRMLYVPEQFAHGYQSLVDDTEVVYQVSESYAPQAERGLRFNDPQFNISWPLPVTVISEKDSSWPGYSLVIRTKHSAGYTS